VRQKKKRPAGWAPGEPKGRDKASPLTRNASDFQAPVSEQAIQRTVFDHLRWRAAPGVFCFHPPNGGWRSKTEAAIFKGAGVVAGVPDVIVIKAGRVYGLELKAESGRLSNTQRDTLAAMTIAGAICGVSFGLDQALRWLESHALLRGRLS
jgi:hypothetical protein